MRSLKRWPLPHPMVCICPLQVVAVEADASRAVAQEKADPLQVVSNDRVKFWSRQQLATVGVAIVMVEAMEMEVETGMEEAMEEERRDP